MEKVLIILSSSRSSDGFGNVRQEVLCGALVSLVTTMEAIRKSLNEETFSDRLNESIIAVQFVPDGVLVPEAGEMAAETFFCCFYCGAPIMGNGCPKCSSVSLHPMRYADLLVVPKKVELFLRERCPDVFPINPETARQNQRNMLVTRSTHSSDRMHGMTAV